MLDTTTAFGRVIRELAEDRGFSGADELVRRANRRGLPEESFPWAYYGDDFDAVIDATPDERKRIVRAWCDTYFSEPADTSSAKGGAEAFPVGSWERPDAAGIVLRGGAVGFTGYVERYGEPPVCFVGSKPGEACERPAVMEVYGLAMCKQHGEEAAAGALEEITYDLEQELQRPMNDHVRRLSPHLERALSWGFDSLPEGADDHERADAALLEAFPLDLTRVCAETLNHARDPYDHRARVGQSPHDAFMGDRLLLHRHMRLAFEEDADWLVEVLEAEREKVAAQAAYALALDKEAGDRPTPEDGEES